MQPALSFGALLLAAKMMFWKTWKRCDMHQLVWCKLLCFLHVVHFFFFVQNRKSCVTFISLTLQYIRFLHIPIKFQTYLRNAIHEMLQVILGRKFGPFFCREDRNQASATVQISEPSWQKFASRITTNASRGLSAYFLRFSCLNYEQRFCISG